MTENSDYAGEKTLLQSLRSPEWPGTGFDPLKESNTSLVKLGFPPRPNKETHPSLRKLWERIMSRHPEYAKGKLKILEEDHPLTVKRRILQQEGLVVNNDDATTLSGAELKSPPPGEFFDVVNATWTVPIPWPPKHAKFGLEWQTGKWTSSIWVGFDGDRTITGPPLQLLQAGTIQEVVTSGGQITSQTAYAMTEWWPDFANIIVDLPVNPGDTVSFQICARPTSVEIAGSATVYASNLSTNISRFVEIHRPPNVTSLGASAKWLIEDPATDLAGNDRTPFPAFGELVFTDCSASTPTRVVQSKDATLVDYVVDGWPICKAESLGDESIVVRYVPEKFLPGLKR
jgi:Peptidase A4 family